MEKIIITIDTVNSAFDTDPATEVARILRDIAKDMEGGYVPTVFDTNGNRVGSVKIIPQRA